MTSCATIRKVSIVLTKAKTLIHNRKKPDEINAKI